MKLFGLYFDFDMNLIIQLQKLNKTQCGLLYTNTIDLTQICKSICNKYTIDLQQTHYRIARDLQQSTIYLLQIRNRFAAHKIDLQ